MNYHTKHLQQYFPKTAGIVGPENWQRFCSGLPVALDGEALTKLFSGFARASGLPPHAEDIFTIERDKALVEASGSPEAGDASSHSVNPTLRLLKVAYQGLAALLRDDAMPESGSPEPGEEFILVWRMPSSGEIRVEEARPEDLLALKIVAEGLDIRELAQQGATTIGALDDILFRAGARGILMRPPSKLVRDPQIFCQGEIDADEYLTARGFTIQWHITQACDLHCKHCYDRSDRSPMPYEKALGILEDLRAFCEERRVYGNVTFTGGNPFLYPRFFDLYRAAADYGFGLAILGNPVSRESLERMLAIQQPSHYQISLEGLRERNDDVRGEGHFCRSLEFLIRLRELGISSMVMLTLTNDNIDDVIPLGDLLREYTDTFHFNRLAMVGEGANLRLPEKARYRQFLREYLKAMEENPILGLKDNFLNLALREQGKPLFGGCAGFGCAAAFNFVAILPDGEVHACRKFPSVIGNIFEQKLSRIYDSAAADKYRSGSSACRPCPVRAVCGGCLAVTYGCGLDISQERDPLCFIDD